LIRALEKTYVINFKTKEDVAQMWVGLSQIRSLLPVQMSQEEEELMRERLWYELIFYDMNVNIFYNMPLIIRITIKRTSHVLYSPCITHRKENLCLAVPMLCC